MPPKLIELQEAAKLLGVTPERLNEMRSNSEIFGYRDGSSWKFKTEELERVAEELGVALGDSGPRSDDSIAALFADEAASDAEKLAVGKSEADEIESPLVTDEDRPANTALGQDEVAGASDMTLAGDQPNPLAGESDLELAADDELQLETKPLGGSGIDLGVGGSDLQLSGGSELELAGGSDLAGGSTGDTGNMGSALGGDIEADDDLEMADEMVAMDDDSSVIELRPDDEEILLESGGSDIGSDIGLGAGDSGINLTSPTDSGINLEDASVDLQSASDIESFDIPDTDNAFPGDDDFRLTPVGDLEENDESDSGSQVIAIEEGTFLGVDEGLDEEGAGDGAFQEIDADPIDIADQPAEIDISSAAKTERRTQPQSYVPEETPYSVWQVCGLAAISFILLLTGALMMDLVRNIWSFDQPYSATSSLMTSIISALGL